MNILASLGALSTPQAQQLMGLQTTQNMVQQLTAHPATGGGSAATPAVTVDLSPAAQAALNARSAAALATNEDSGGLVVDAGTTGYDDGGYAAQQAG